MWIRKTTEGDTVGNRKTYLKFDLEEALEIEDIIRGGGNDEKKISFSTLFNIDGIFFWNYRGIH